MKLRRWVALLLAAAMALSLLCGAAWAAEPEEAEENALLSFAEELPDEAAEESDEDEDAPEAVEETPLASDPDEEPDEDSYEDPDEDPADWREPDGSAGDAEEELPEGQEGETAAEGLVNPLYEDFVSPEALEQSVKALEAEDEEVLETQSSSKAYTSIQKAGSYMRGQLKKRQTNIKLKFKTKNNNPGSIARKIFNEAVKHTGKPTEGDYLYGQWAEMVWKTKWKYSKKKYTYTYQFRVSMFTTAAQEKKTDEAVRAILHGLKLGKDGRFLKVHKIYNYICDNVRYDYAGANNPRDLLCHSAYAAAVKKKAVCQGYAVLLYRMLLQADVPCRYISGIGGGDRHAWNIIKLGGAYYNADATWDANLRQDGQYFSYFLRSNAGFPDHRRGAEYRSSSFVRAYPMSAQNADFHVWETEWRRDTEPTCTDKGSESIHCMDCGEKRKSRGIPALGHSLEEYTTYYYTDSYRVWYHCTRCGQYLFEDYPYSSNLYGSSGTIQARGVTRSWSAEEQRFSLKAKSRGGTLHYRSDRAQVRVDGKGTVTVAARFAGQARITIRSEATERVPEAKRTVVVTVRPRAPVLRRVKAAGKGALRVCWKRHSSAAGYELQYSTDRRFRKGVKRVTAGKGVTTATLRGLKKGRIYYLRLRATAGAAKSGWSGSGHAKVK